MFIITGIKANDSDVVEVDGFAQALHARQEMETSGAYRQVTVREDLAVWATGRCNCNACISVSIYEHIVIAAGDKEQLTAAMMRRALRREFPHHTFSESFGDRNYLRMDADRWDGDGLAQVEEDLREGDRANAS